MAAEIGLRDGAVTRDRRMDRIGQDDIRNSEFPVRMLMGPQMQYRLRSYSWQIPVHYDQGRGGGCVAYAIAHHLVSRPHAADLTMVRTLLDSKELLAGAQKRDPWPGRSGAGGTSVLAGVRQAKATGLIAGYHWAGTEREVAEAIAWYSPVIIGVNWYQTMTTPTADGLITIGGQRIGGHCTVVSGFDLATGVFRIHNSWGTGWGHRGDAFIHRRDLASLLREPGAQACVPSYF